MHDSMVMDCDPISYNIAAVHILATLLAMMRTICVGAVGMPIDPETSEVLSSLRTADSAQLQMKLAMAQEKLRHGQKRVRIAAPTVGS